MWMYFTPLNCILKRALTRMEPRPPPLEGQILCKAGDLGSIPGLGRSLGEGEGYSLQYSGLENSMDCIVYGVAKSWTRLSDFHFVLIHHAYIDSR